MKRSTFVTTFAAFLTGYSSSTFGLTCPAYTPPNDESIQLEIDAEEVSVTLPALLDGNELDRVILWVYRDADNDVADLVASLTFEIDAVTGIAKAGFFTKSFWEEIEITAAYGTNLCGPRPSALIKPW